jgi:hypothetical protein
MWKNQDFETTWKEYQQWCYRIYMAATKIVVSKVLMFGGWHEVREFLYT